MRIENQLAPKTHGDFWAALRLPARETNLYELVHHGLSFELLDQLACLVQMSRADLSHAISVSPRALARRAKAGRFSTAESDRLVALIAVFEEALSLFEGDFTATRKWMDSPVRGLGLKKPLDMLGTRVEANAVLDLIGMLARGVLV
ncbi:antitoxin Xre-like helix-turn-helix domain-containing protein [Pseudomonas mohnii]